AAQLEAIVARSGGIPLYLEQLVKAAVGGFDVAQRRNGTHREGAGRAPERGAIVPATIDDALMAQLDQLGPAKEVAQHAAVIGPECELGLLARIMARPQHELVPMLRDLERSRIVEPGGAHGSGSVGAAGGGASGARPAEIYRFKHSLIQDISYRSLLRKNRRQ